MATQIRSFSLPQRHRVRLDKLQRLGVLTLVAMAGGAALGNAADSAGVKICGESDALLEQFALQHDEKPQALGLGADGGVIEVLVPPEGGWTMLVTYSAKPTCVVAMGQAWESVQPMGGAPA
jgi:hypothetical protein